MTEHAVASGSGEDRAVRRDDLRAAWPTGHAWPIGLCGMVLFLATEAALFGLLIVSYYYLRIYARQWPPAGVEEPKVLWPLVLLGVVVATSITMQIASSSARRGARTAAVGALALAFVAQACYLALTLLLFRRDLHDFSPRDNSYGSAYYTLLGVHDAHVALGVLLTAFVLARVARRLTAYRVTAVRAVTLYWHVINAIAIAVTITVLSPSLL